MKNKDYFSFKFENDQLVFIDQTKLPFQEVYETTDQYERIASAIERLEIRGAPAIGITAGYALALSLKNTPKNIIQNKFSDALARLKRTRPTAVNLFKVLNEVENYFFQNSSDPNIFHKLLKFVEAIHLEDISFCDRIARNGLNIFTKKSSILTHCNTGKLAAGGDGTAFNIIKFAHQNDLISHVYADETRPLLQGSRLTSFELYSSEIPFSILTDSSAAFLMAQNKVDLVITGADRIALNGDTANKIGTYNLAVLCNYHNIPFYIAAPSSTIDRHIPTGNEIEIEYRSKKEIIEFNGISVCPAEFDAFNPAFDITPSHLISGIITEDGVFTFPYNFIQ
ncbi:MAG: S-methyl-5-thioribose-1-phosphate isomerase [Ignavibacteriales bacterium]|nr:S-methyl-5-thioribose-1-phosphate isomerase [Ignavibacteriales bacterium]